MDARIQVSARDQLSENCAPTSWVDVPCPASACFRPNSDQPLRGCYFRSARYTCSASSKRFASSSAAPSQWWAANGSGSGSS